MWHYRTEYCTCPPLLIVMQHCAMLHNEATKIFQNDSICQTPHQGIAQRVVLEAGAVFVNKGHVGIWVASVTSAASFYILVSNLFNYNFCFWLMITFKSCWGDIVMKLLLWDGILGVLSWLTVHFGSPRHLRGDVLAGGRIESIWDL